MITFDEKYWSETVRKPDWYLEFVKLAERAKTELGEESPEIKRLNKQVRQFFEQALVDGKVALAVSGPDWDQERQAIDTVVIHHTSADPGYRLSYMNAVQLLNIYASYYASPYDERDKSVRGQPIWSNHTHDGKPVFYAYHWLMRMDGSFERLLDDDQIGWHAGNWDINRRSVAICLDNDYENQNPMEEILRQLAEFLKNNYPSTKLIGHCEARAGTICPGVNFMGGWKNKLLGFL